MSSAIIAIRIQIKIDLSVIHSKISNNNEVNTIKFITII